MTNRNDTMPEKVKTTPANDNHNPSKIVMKPHNHKTKITYRSGPSTRNRTKCNQMQYDEIIYKRPIELQQTPLNIHSPTTYVHPSTVRKKRLELTSLLKNKLNKIDTKIYLVYMDNNNDYSQFNNCKTNQPQPETMPPKSSRTTSKPKTAYQAMLQRGIDGYMAEKQPDSSKKKANSNTQLKTPDKPRTHPDADGTPPSSNITNNNATEQPLPDSDEETEEEYQKRIENEKLEDEEARATTRDSLTDEEKRLDDEDDNIMDEIEKSAEESRLAQKQKETEPLNLTDDIENEHGPQAKLDEQLKPKTPEERLKEVRERAKKRAEQQRKEKEEKRKEREAAKKDRQSKKKQCDKAQEKQKSTRKEKASAALKQAEKEAEEQKQENKNDTEKQNEKSLTEDKAQEDHVEIIENTQEAEDSESDEEYDDKNNPYSIAAQAERKRKNAKKEKKMMRKIKRPYNSYYTLKLKIHKSENAMDELINAASKWLTNLQIVDPSAIIYGYKDNTPTHGIMKPSEIPKGIVAFKEFFLGANPTGYDGFAWTQVWIGHALEADDIYANLKFWLKKNETAMYYKKLQQKHTVRNYFLLWSTAEMCPKKLYEETQHQLSKITKEKHEFAFVWGVIRREDGAYNKKESQTDKGNQYVRALHIEVPKDTAELTYRALSNFFGSHPRKLILFRKLRMVPVLLKSYTTRTKDKIRKLIALQKSYTSRLDSALCYDFNNIDIVRDEIGKSMRQIVMGLRTLDGTDQLIFTSIDYDEFSECHKLTFPKALTSHAFDYMAQLPAFLRWAYDSDNVFKMFTDAAIEKAMEAPWSEEEMCTVSKQEMDMDVFAEDMRDHEWMADMGDEINSEVINIDDIEHVRKTETFLFKRATDDGSVSTFNHKNDNKHINDNCDDTQNNSPSKKFRVTSVQTKDDTMEDVTTQQNNKQLHTMEIMLTSKEEEIMSLRQRLEALTASGDNSRTQKVNEAPGTKDRSPSDSTGKTPGQATDLGGNL